MNKFPGETINDKLDTKRLTKQHDTIRELMLDGKYRTLHEIESITGYPQSSISAQLRHLKKKKFGSYRLVKRRALLDRASGLFEYKILEPLPPEETKGNLL